MESNTSFRSIRSGIAILFLVGMLFIPIQKVGAVPIHEQQTSDQITVNPLTGLVTTEGGGTAAFTVVLNTLPSADVTIGVSSSDTTEGTVSPSSLTFTTANWSTPQTVTVTGVDDQIADSGIAYQIVVAPAVSADPVFNGQDASDVSVTNLDNDTAGITVTPTSGLTTTEAGVTDTFTIVLTSLPTADVTIGLSSSDITEGTVSPSSLTFTTANWNTARTVTVTGVDDSVADGSILYSIITAASSSADPGYNNLNPADVAVTNLNNDNAGITVTPTSGLITTEALGSTSFTIVLTSQPTANVTIGLSSSDITEGTVSPANLTFTGANWSTAQTVAVTGVNDFLVDGSILYTIVTAQATSSDLTYNTMNAADVSVTNQDNDTAGITVAPTSGLTTTEAGGTATFTVVLTSQPTADVTIGLSSSDTTEGTVSPTSLTFTNSSWSSQQTVTVTGANDSIIDGSIPYTIITAQASSGDSTYNNMIVADVSVTNTDNDTAGITVSPTSGLVTSEGGGTATFTVVLSSQPAANVTIDFSSSDTSEGTVSPTSRVFTNGNWNTEQTITVTGVDDSLVDGNILYTIVTSQAVSTDTNYSVINPADVTVTNTDNDVAGITVTPISGLTTTEVGGTATFTVVLTSQPTANVTIGLSSSDTSEGTVTPAEVTFTSANWNGPQTVTVTGVDDSIADGPIGYTIVTAPAVSTDGNYSGRDAANVSVTNTDNDVAGITVTPVAGLTTTEAGGAATFTVVLASQPTANVTIGLSSNDTSEGTVAPASLTFTTANWSSTQTVTVTGVDDQIADGNIAYQIVTAAATSSDTAYNTLNASDVAVTNTDNDVAGITVNPTTGLTTTEAAGGTTTFTVVLTSQPAANVTIGVSSNDTTEGTVAPASLVFTSANYNVAQTVIITGVDDPVADGNIVYQIVTAQAVSTDATYAAINPADVSVTNTDNDVAGITVNPITGLTTTEAGGTTTFTVVLTSQPSANVTIALSSSDITEGTVSPASLTFTNANYSAPQTVTVTGVDDPAVDGNIAYQIVTAQAVSTDTTYAAINPADVSVTNTDNDVAGFIINPTTGLTTTEAGGTVTFTVVLTSQPNADVLIGLSSSDIGEGTVSPTSLTFTSSNWSAAQTVTVTGINDSEVDGPIAYTIITAAAVSTDTTYNTLNAADVSVTNTDNDVAGITVNPTTGLVTTEAGGTATFTVVLTSQPSANVTIALSSSDTTEGTVAPASLVFTTANWNVLQTVTVTGVDDLNADLNIAYQIITAAAVSTDPNYSARNAADVSVTNTNNDTAAITVSPTTGLNTNEAGGTATFTVVLTSQPTANVVIGLSSSDTTEGTVSPASLTFTSVNWNVPQTVTVTGVNDMMADGPINYTIVTAAATSTDTSYSGMNAADVAVINQDNDTAGTTVNPTSGLVTTEAGGTATFTVVLNTQPTANVTINLTSSDITEGTVSPASLVFTTTDWNTVRTVTVTGVNDPEDDGNQPFSIITANAISTDAGYSNRVVPDVAVTNTNNDFTPVAVPDTYLTNAVPDQPFNKAAPGVLSNDTDANNDALTAIMVSGPANGDLALSPNGSFVYTPDANFGANITDSFTYQAKDGGNLISGITTVQITIDQIAPSVNWVSPAANETIFECGNQYLILEVEATEPISQVYFYRWDAITKSYVTIGVLNNAPYQLNLDTTTLNFFWNQVFVSVRDMAGNESSRQFIWLYRNLPFRIYMPRISR